MFIYYQPNKKDVKDEYGDCTIRALSKVLNLSWIETFDLTVPVCRKYQTSGIFSLPNKLEKEAMAELGYTFEDILNFYFTGITLERVGFYA